MLSVVGILLAVSLASGPHAVRPDDVCLLRDRCAREPVYCLVADPRCETPGRAICFVDGCIRPDLPDVPDLRGLEP